MITTVLFDLDGTILDTNELIISSFLHTLDGVSDKTFLREDIIPHMGYSLIEQIKFFTGLEQVEDLILKYRKFNIDNHDVMVREFPHVREVLEQLQAANIKMGVVTNKMQITTVMGLKLCGLDKFMDTIITVDDVPRGKPDPAMVQLALDRLQTPAEQALMVGDSQYDIQAAHAAGVASVGVAWSMKGEEHLRTFDPTYLIQDMRDLLEIVGIKR